jgi:lycopene beta-cyclase
MLLDIMTRHGDHIKDIFTQMFRSNPPERLFRFLDEEASFWENAQLIATLPPRRFLEALCQKKVWQTLTHLPSTRLATRPAQSGSIHFLVQVR